MHGDQFNSFLFHFVALFIPPSLCDTSEHCVCCLIGRGSIRAYLCDIRAPDDSDENLLTTETFLLLPLKLSVTTMASVILRALSELRMSRCFEHSGLIGES